MNTNTLIDHLLVNLEEQAMALKGTGHRNITLRLDLNCLAPQADHVTGYELREVHHGEHGMELRLSPSQYRCPDCGTVFKINADICSFICPNCEH